MVFSSLLFIFAFLTPCLIIYTLVDRRYKNRVLLISSLIFYAWGGLGFVAILIADAFFSWLFALQIEKNRSGKMRRLFLVLACVCLLGFLVVFKYTNFFAANLHALFGVPKVIPHIILPIGISFYTFQLLSYVVDVYRGEVDAQPNYFKLLLYASLFHQCIAGPIVRYSTVAKEIENRRVSRNDLYYGIRRFCVGLAKKAILANGCAAIADEILNGGTKALHAQSTVALWVGMFAYMLEIYLDFSAYSDMAIGMGRMVGFHYLENFNYPYIAKSVQDFWRRWHISLSTFFRDYVYIPLGGSRCSKRRFIFNMAVVWFLTGMWHGASWNYIFWGLFYLVFLLLERFVIRNRMPSWLAHIYTLFVVYIGWVLFRFENFREVGVTLAGLIGIGTASLAGLQIRTVIAGNMFCLIFCIIACTPLGKMLRKRVYGMAKKSTVWFYIFEIQEAVLPVILLILAVLALIGNTYNPFLYFQF